MHANFLILSASSSITVLVCDCGNFGGLFAFNRLSFGSSVGNSSSLDVDVRFICSITIVQSVASFRRPLGDCGCFNNRVHCDSNKRF